MTEEERALRDLQARLALEAENAAREAARQRRQAHPTDYVFDKQQEMFWDLMDGTLHSEKGVDASIPQERWRVIVEDEGDAPPAEGEQRRRGRPRQRRERLVPPSTDIRRVENDQFVESSTWWPGQDRIIHDMLINENGFFASEGRRAYNRYRPPINGVGKPDAALPWIEHVKRLWPEPKEHNHFFDYCAHMIQRPEIKCNSAVVLSGKQGIGKDAALDPVRRAVGAWNAKNIEPDHLFSQYKPWLETLMLVVDEARPTKDDFHSSSMYNVLKPLTAAPPEVLALNDKYKAIRYVVNVLRVFITTNDYLSLFIPAEDRRMFVLHSPMESLWHIAEGKPDYFDAYWQWLEKGGYANVAAWLAQRDIKGFNSKVAPPKTMGWESIADTWAPPDDAIEQALEALEYPPMLFGSELLRDAFDHKDDIQAMFKSPRKLSHRMQLAGYTTVAPKGKSKRWDFVAGGKRFRSRFAFVKSELCRDMPEVVAALEKRGEELAIKLSRGAANVTPLRPKMEAF